jgi:hypothetical protein
MRRKLGELLHSRGRTRAPHPIVTGIDVIWHQLFSSTLKRNAHRDGVKVRLRPEKRHVLGSIYTKETRQLSVQECALEPHVSYGIFGTRIHSSSDVNITKFATCESLESVI